MSGFTPEMRARAEKICSLYPQVRSALIPLCHLAQEQAGYLREDLMIEIAELVDVTPAEVYGTASFYDMLHTEPVGKYLVGVCTNIACLMQGGEDLLEYAEEKLGVAPGGTTDDGLFTLEDMECIAHCNKAPALQVNYRFFGPVDEDGFDKMIDDLREGRLADDVPSHGTLIREERSAPIALTMDEVLKERAVSDAAIAQRKAQVQS
jgi:NADH-quinone oxidoreductase E subunit